MDETKLTNTDQRIQAWYNVYDLCLSLGMDVTDKTGEQAVLDFIARIQELETAGRPFADLAKYYNGLDDEFAISIGTLDAESIFFTVGELRQLAALLNNTEKE